MHYYLSTYEKPDHAGAIDLCLLEPAACSPYGTWHKASPPRWTSSQGFSSVQTLFPSVS